MRNSLYILFILLGSACKDPSNKEVTSNNIHQYSPRDKEPIAPKELKKYQQELNIFFDTTLLNSNFNGGILIAKGGNVLYEKYKSNDSLGNIPITENTPLHIASVSKTFTGVATLHLVQEGKLSLSDLLEKYFPGFPYKGVTIRSLLNHRSGLPNYLFFIPKSKKANAYQITNQDVLDVLMQEKPSVNFPPNTHFSYSNTNFVLLALIIEKITGQHFPQYMQENYFSPLGMDHTFIRSSDTTPVIMSYKPNGSVWPNDNLESTYGDKNVYSTPQDLLKWDEALYGNTILNQAMKDSAFKPYSLEKPSIHNYGLGFRMIIMPNGKKVIYHYGRWHGFNAAFARLIDEKATIIILGNRFTRSIYSSARRSYDFFGPYGQNANLANDEADLLPVEKEAKLKKKPPLAKQKKK